MTELSPVRTERAALCDLFEQVGPDAPTLCGEWRTADLVSHLYVREHDPVAGAGILVPQLASYTDRAMEKARGRLGYEGLIAEIRKGPPFGPFRWFEDEMNLNEYFVHHEDVRRGGGTGEPREPESIAELERELWKGLERTAKLMTRSLRGVGLVLEWPGRGAITVRRGDPFVTLTGPPSELVLYLNGRKGVARVDLDGPPDDREKVATASFGV